jgi:phosphomannomutase
MKRIYIFDIDGTLTPPRLPMTEEMVGLFTDFCKDHKVFLATGSDIIKVEEQVPLAIRQLVKGIFTCSGNKFFQDERVIYEKEFSPPQELIRLLEDWLKYSSYPVKTGHHLEIRPGMLNFSTVGRNCTQKQREDYYYWDNEIGERKILREKIIYMFPVLDCAIGGQISVDIYPRGMDKSQAYSWIKSEYPKHGIIFCGDRLQPGGNDHPFFRAMSQNYTSCKPLDMVVPVSDWKDTKRFLLNCEKDS